MNTRTIVLLISGLFTVFALGCGSTRLELQPWEKLPKDEYTIPPTARYLSAYKIALDPGHGGLADLPGYKQGPTGKREAIMNLQVAKFLKEFLEQAGVTVVMTRTDDRFVSLLERAQIAERAGCDLLISLHHNAAENPQTNYAAVYYHLHPDYSPASMDVARNIYFGVVEALRLPQVANDGLLTDKLIFPAGFGLLTRARMPAVLLESSFFSNPNEEKRLMDWRYNRREAYGIFLGLVRWAAGGIPSTQRVKPGGISNDKQPQIVYEVRDGITERGGRGAGQLLIYSQTAVMRLDGRTVPAKMDMASKRLLFRPDSVLSNGPHLLQTEVQNLFKNHNLPRIDTLIVAAPVKSIQFAIPTTRLPADDAALMPIRLQLLDADSLPVWDGTTVQLHADLGTLSPEQTQLHNGSAIVYFRAPREVGTTTVVATADGYSDSLTLALVSPGQDWVLSGVVVDDSTTARLDSAIVAIDDSVWTTSDANGGFFLLNAPTGSHALSVRLHGYAPERRIIDIDSSRSMIMGVRLRANWGGLFHQASLILDPALGGTVQGDTFPGDTTAANANLMLVSRLADVLRWAGARVTAVRQSDTTLSSQRRIATVNNIPVGWYLKFGYRQWDADSVLVQSTIYPANDVGAQLATAIHTAFARLPKVRTLLRQSTEVPEVTYTNKTAVEVIIRCRNPKILTRDLPAIATGLRSFQEQYLRNQADNLAGEQ